RAAKFAIVRRPTTRTRAKRTCAAATSRSFAPISIPTPDPLASSLRKSRGMEVWVAMPGSVAPGRIVPAEDVHRRLHPLPHEFHLRRDRALQIGKLPIGQPQLRRRAKGKHGVALNAEAIEWSAYGLQEWKELLIGEWRHPAAFDQRGDR